MFLLVMGREKAHRGSHALHSPGTAGNLPTHTLHSQSPAQRLRKAGGPSSLPNPRDSSIAVVGGSDFAPPKSKTKPVRSQTHPHTTSSEKPKKSGVADCWPSSKHQSPRTPDSDKVIPTSFHIHVNVRSSHTHRQCLPRTLLSVFFLFPVF